MRRFAKKAAPFLAITLLLLGLGVTPAAADGARGCGVEKEDRLITQVPFSDRSAALAESADEAIRTAAIDILAHNADEVCLITVIADPDLPRSESLSRKRAEAVARRLMELGVRPQIIIIELQTKSSRWPLWGRDDEAKRRVDIVFED